MRRLCLLIVLSYLCTSSIEAQELLTLEDAIRSANKNNIELKEHALRIERAEAVLNESERLPNPTLSYSREDLKGSGESYYEWTASGSIPINFLWDRWSNMESKEKILEAEKMLYDYAELKTEAEVRKTYHALFSYMKISEKLDKAMKKLNQISESARQRFREGDISEYEFHRISAEVDKMSAASAEVELEAETEWNKLKLITGMHINKKIELEPDKTSNEIMLHEEELMERALKSRKDLQAIETLIESEKLFLTHNKLNSIPTIYTGGGYKKQSDIFSGSIIQLELELPLFKRNQSDIELTEIRIKELRQNSEFLDRKIKSEISQAYSLYIMSKKLKAGRDEKLLQKIFETASYSYEEGEIGIVEFIDGLEAFIEGSIKNHEIEIELNKSIYELEKAAGITLIQ